MKILHLHFRPQGKKASDFIGDPTVFEIQYKTPGDLNEDGLSESSKGRCDIGNKQYNG